MEAGCPHWLHFLETTFNNDIESIQAIQRWFGYLLLPDTSLQKMLFVIGPPRSGKGTIARVLTSLIGRSSITTPTLTDLAGPFCLQGMIGKTVAIVGDVRLSRRADDVAITERLLSITGEDYVDVHRKHLETLNSVRLPIRFTLFSNELPYLNDSSNALLSRCIFIVMPNSYLGREDRQLGKRLESELPGILNWAIAGRYLLQEEGEIKQPESGKDMYRQMQIISSPISSFIEEACEKDHTSSVSIHDLFEAWCNWSRENGIQYQPNIQTFGKKMRDVIPNLKISRSGSRGSQVRNFLGIKFKDDFYSEIF
jgi:putative DNA primase/helicase